MLAKHRLLAVNCVLLLVLGGTQWGRRIEGATLSRGDFLQELRLPFRDWKPREIALTATEREMLQPDSAVVRRYEAGDGSFAELAVIAGHRKRTVHTPGFCMLGDGWQLVSQKTYSLPLPGGPVPATRTLMTKKGLYLVVTYFFTNGEYSTNSLVRFQAAQLLRRFETGLPVGALVRILIPVTSNPEATEALADEFAAATLPPVMKSVREAGRDQP